MLDLDIQSPLTVQVFYHLNLTIARTETKIEAANSGATPEWNILGGPNKYVERKISDHNTVQAIAKPTKADLGQCEINM
jgi:hypothetical protein